MVGVGGLWHEFQGRGPVLPSATMEASPTLPCPFCQIEPGRIVASNELAFAISDRFPVNPGHTLAIPHRHVANWFEATPAEQRALMALVSEAKREMDSRPNPPDGYNIGINVGEAAGQTVMHLHVHLIPRFAGDVEDPRGGVRFVVPARGSYLPPGPEEA